jgi:Ran GTPase-activating protein (RanGAP) involved in mRNA processing and transport
MRQAGCEQWVYRRGFVDTVVIPGAAFLQFAAILFQTGPVQRVRLTGAVADLAALASIEQLTRLSELSLHGCGIGNAGARTLAASPYLRNLTVIDLSYNDIGDSGAQALASSPNLSRLTALYLNRPTMVFDPTGQDIIQDVGACALASSPHLARLTELGLSGNLIGRDGWEALRSRFGQVEEPVSCGTGAIKPLHLTGAAITVSRGS